MYIFELLFRVFKGKPVQYKNNYNPVDNQEEIVENSEECDHLFMPLDSTNTMFACKHCGLIVSKDKLKNKNIFENRSF